MRPIILQDYLIYGNWSNKKKISEIKTVKNDFVSKGLDKYKSPIKIEHGSFSGK